MDSRRYPDNSLVFDVSTPAGQKKLEVVSNLVKASLYEHWGESRKAVIDRIKAKVAGGYPVRVSEYNFEAGQNIAGLQDIFTVKVKDADATVSEVKNRVRDILQVNKLVGIREFLVNKAAKTSSVN